MHILLRKMTDVVHQITGPGAALNAMHEVNRATSSMVDVDTQLQRLRPTGTRRAA